MAALARHDAASGTAYVETLRAFLDDLGDMTLASKHMHVHPNTFATGCNDSASSRIPISTTPLSV